MRKVFLIFLSLAIIFFFNLIKINAQESSILFPGVNCGVPGDIRTSKCCTPIKMNVLQAPEFGDIFNTVKNIVLGPVLKFIQEKFGGPLIDFQQKITQPCQPGSHPSIEDPADINCRCLLDEEYNQGPLTRLQTFCDSQTKPNDKNNCNSCIKAGGVWTGIGCVEGSASGFIRNTVFGLGIGLAGGFALLCIIYAAFMMQSSQGNPEKLKKAQEMITSCIMGLMLIIFSVFILRLIGVNILQIPGFK